QHVGAQDGLVIVKRVEQDVRNQHGAQRQPPFHDAWEKSAGTESQPVKGTKIRRKQSRPPRQRGQQHENVRQPPVPSSSHKPSIRRKPEIRKPKSESDYRSPSFGFPPSVILSAVRATVCLLDNKSAIAGSERRIVPGRWRSPAP